MKTFLFALLLPCALSATCKDCHFPYQVYLRQYLNHYEHLALRYCNDIVDVDDLKNAEEKAIFYSGAAFSIHQVLRSQEDY